ncbi:MAG: hypothetical protein KF684_09925 [Phycisphaeraceae bacterium]|nr:hypothetical protein [Phycisphaeraceae bacterium]
MSESRSGGSDAKKGGKLFKIGVGLGALALGLVLVSALLFVVLIDGIAKRGIERGGTYALAVPTTLDSASVGLMSGSFSMAGLEVKNPEGFTAPHFLKLGDGSVNVTLGSLTKDVVELPTLTLSGIDMYLVKEGGKANYQVIMDNLKRFETEEKQKPATDDGKKFVIRRVELNDVTVRATVLPIGGAANTVDVKIPQIVLNDVGSGGKSVSMAQIMDIVIKAVFSTAISLDGALPGDIADGLKGGLAQLGSLGDMGVGVAAQVGGQAVEVIGGVAGEAGKAIEGVGKNVEDAAKGITNLFGGGKKDEPKKDDK